MPYKSAKQRSAMHAKADRGEIPKSVVKEFDKASKGLKLQAKAPKKKRGE